MSSATFVFILVAVSLYDAIDGVCFRNSVCSQFYHIRKVANNFQEHRIQCENLLSLTIGNGTSSFVELSDGSHVVRGISGGKKNNRLMVYEAMRDRAYLDDFFRRFAAASPDTDTSTCGSGSMCVNVTVGSEVVDSGIVDVKTECDRASSALKLAIEGTKKKGDNTDRKKIPMSDSTRLLRQMVVKMGENHTARATERRPDVRNGPSADARPTRARRSLLFPGTRWCGVGNSSTEEDTVGAIVPVDKCCQEHDSCEHVIEGFTTRYNLYNFRFHTVSHCECDDRFRTCLRALGDSHADEIGRWFFNYIGMRCFVFRKERVCAQRTWWGQCTRYTMQPTAVVHDTQLTY